MPGAISPRFWAKTIVIVRSLYFDVQCRRRRRRRRRSSSSSSSRHFLLPSPGGDIAIGRVCWFVTLVVMFRKVKSNFHEICHFCSASATNVTIRPNFRRVKVNVHYQNRCIENLSTNTTNMVILA